MVVDGDRITAIGRAAELGAAGLPRTHIEGVLMGALRDAHIHPGGYAATVAGLSVADSEDFGELRERIIQAALQLPPGAPVVGSRLDEHRLAEGRLPTRADLDVMLEHRPIFLTRACGHVAVASSSALRRAGLTARTPDPPGGIIDRDEQGEPTGVLRETAIALVSAALADDAPAPGPDRLLAAISGLTALGIGRIDAIVATGSALWCGAGSELDELLAIASDLPIDVRCFTIASTPAELEAAAHRIRSSPGRLSWAGWKSFADGSLGGFTAAMDRPFADGPGTGTLRLDPATARVMVQTTLEMGGIAAIHAIGDRANRAVIDLYRSLDEGRTDPARLRVEHASVLSEQLIGDFAASGVIASVQPAFIASEAGWLVDRVGAERARWTYPLRSLTRAGVPLVAGSDSPVEDPDPWKALAAACENPITPAESLDRETALEMYGANRLTVGGMADIIALDRNPLTTDGLGQTRVVASWIGGRPTEFEAMAWPG